MPIATEPASDPRLELARRERADAERRAAELARETRRVRLQCDRVEAERRDLLEHLDLLAGNALAAESRLTSLLDLERRQREHLDRAETAASASKPIKGAEQEIRKLEAEAADLRARLEQVDLRLAELKLAGMERTEAARRVSEARVAVEATVRDKGEAQAALRSACDAVATCEAKLAALPPAPAPGEPYPAVVEASEALRAHCSAHRLDFVAYSRIR